MAKTTKKTTAKKPVAKKTTTKKATAKKAVTRKPTTKTKGKGIAIQTTPKATAIRRPDPALPPSAEVVNQLTVSILSLIETLDNYAAHLRALDRQRHNGVGLRRLGFIETAFRLSSIFPQYFPHWLDTEKFQRDLDLFNAVRALVEVCRSLEEKAWNINVEAADMVYTDALEYYSQVQDAARRRIDSAESIYTELNSFFHRGSYTKSDGAPTVKKIKHDVNALLKGTKDGEVIIKNIKPKLTGGKHEVIDETFNDKASFKETEQGSITE